MFTNTEMSLEAMILQTELVKLHNSELWITIFPYAVSSPKKLSRKGGEGRRGEGVSLIIKELNTFQ